MEIIEYGRITGEMLLQGAVHQLDSARSGLDRDKTWTKDSSARSAGTFFGSRSADPISTPGA